MVKRLEEWVETDVTPVKSKPLKWLSEEHFFRDPSRPTFSDTDYFFSPAIALVRSEWPDLPAMTKLARVYATGLPWYQLRVGVRR